MPLPLGTTGLTLFRRHFCPSKGHAPCQCPIWARGYLPNETTIRNGRTVLKYVRLSLNTRKMEQAEKTVNALRELGRIPRA